MVKQEFYIWKLIEFQLERLRKEYIIGAVVKLNFDFIGEFDDNLGCAWNCF